MRSIIREVGPFTLRPERNRFWQLVRSIISQQISVGAARSIHARLEQLLAPDRVSPECLLRFEPAELRTAGLSPQKAAYLLDLAEKTQNGTLRLNTVGRRSDEAVIEELIQVKGIGRWTAQMFLIFALGRLDIFPYDDLGVRVAIRDRYGLKDLPDKKTSCQIAEKWRPYSSIGSWYCWRSIDISKNRKNVAKGNPT